MRVKIDDRYFNYSGRYDDVENASDEIFQEKKETWYSIFRRKIKEWIGI